MGARSRTDLVALLLAPALGALAVLFGGACRSSASPDAPSVGVARPAASPVAASPPNEPGPRDADALSIPLGLADASSPSPNGAIDAADVLYPDTSVPLPDCPPAADRARCLVAARYASDAKARVLALDLFDRTGDVAGIERAHVMDGGYRGMLRIVPALPVNDERVHLARVAAALLDYEQFFLALAGKSRGAAVRYRVHPIALRFMRSVKARTPSAYAVDWTVAYNVAGSLNGNADAVRETLFHEIFHLNDAAHGAGDRDWSSTALEPTYAAIVKRCGASTACLTPFAPNATRVRGGTYYAFQPGNDVREYAAELAIRYYREQRGALGQGARVTPSFKCGTAENARAWRALVDEFFGGIDLVGACP